MYSRIRFLEPPGEMKIASRNQGAQDIGGKITEKYYPRETKIASRNPEFSETEHSRISGFYCNSVNEILVCDHSNESY